MQVSQLKTSDAQYHVGDRVYCNVRIRTSTDDEGRVMTRAPCIVADVTEDGYRLTSSSNRQFTADEHHITPALSSPEALIAEWRVHDPYLLDGGGMQTFIDRRLEAQHLRWLMRTIHPCELGLEDISRFDVMHRISEKGLRFLADLGWPTAMNSHYKNLYTGTISTLDDLLWHFHDDLDLWRTEMHRQEEQINDLTNGAFYMGYAAKGLGCTSRKELRTLLHDHPHVEQVIKESLRLHKAFYEHHQAGRYGDPKLLTDKYFHNDSCVSNIVAMCRILGINVDVLEDTNRLPPRTVENHVWAVVENSVPATKDEVSAWLEHHPNDDEAPDE